MFNHSASGNIVFVGFDKNSLPKSASRNSQIASLLSYLEEAGAERIFLDMPLTRDGSATGDIRLRAELDRLGTSVTLAESFRDDFAESAAVEKNDPYFSRGVNLVSNDYQTDFVNFVWGLPAEYEHQNRTVPTLSFALANEGSPREIVYLDYAIDTASVQKIEYSNVEQVDQARDKRFSNNAVIIGSSGAFARQVKIPGVGVVPSTFVHVIGAETLVRGTGQFMDWPLLVSFFGFLLISGVLLIDAVRTRRRFYALWVAAVVAAMIVTAGLGIRAVFIGPLTIGIVFAVLRLVANYRRRHLFLDARSKLPNFEAMKRDLANDYDSDLQAIIVAKIARLDAIFAGLGALDQGRYLRQIASRLALGEAGTNIYYDGGKYFGLFMPIESVGDLQEHLEGLRAVASQSVIISHHPLDVSMTIGGDQCSGKSVASRLSSAIAAADQASEAYRPVFVISDFEADSEEWDHSLQARLEDALSEDRIMIKLQPQVEFRTGKIIGGEALARWVDEEHGEVPPERFIYQCERVGRLDDLTNRILQKSLLAAEKLCLHGHDPSISVNVSAVQLVGHQITDMISKNLAQVPIDPAKLTIEVTETARIENFAVARAIVEEIKQTGVRFSIDDFGIASANLEALLALPFDELKIDRLFVSQMTDSSRARAIVASAIRLAKDAGMVSVAEGIETRESYQILNEMGCDIGQGYLIAHPLSITEFTEMLDLQRDVSRIRRKDS